MSEPLIAVLRRVLALAILCLLPIVAWITVAEPLIGMVTDRQNEIVTLADRLARLRDAIARFPQLRTAEAAAQGKLAAAGGVWTDTNQAVMAATMPNWLR